MKNYKDFNDFAVVYAREKLKTIIKEVKQKRSLLPQLSYLLNQLAEQKEQLHPMQEAKKSKLKYGIIAAYENDKLFNYYESKQIDDEYSKLIESIENNKRFYHDKKNLTVEKYIEANKPLFPFEYSDALLNKNTKDHEILNLDQVAGIVLGQIILIEDIEEELKDLIYETQLNKEDIERLEFLLNKKIKWNEGLNEFAYIINTLMNNNYVDLPADNTSPKKADLFHAHFYIDGNSGKESSVRSMKDAFNNINVKGSGLPKMKKNKIRDIFN